MTREVLAALIAAAARDEGRECCGLLLGSRDAGRELLNQAQPAANVHPDPARHFEIDPAALIAAYRQARMGGPALLGFYHSHPNGHPRPSASDCEHAGGDGKVWAIVAAGAVSFWRDDSAGFEELSAAVVER